MTLELIPNGDLIFKGPFTAVSATTLKLSNSGNERLAYKIKTTAPKRYCVKPNSGYLNQHATAEVQVMLQPQAPGVQDDRTKHKFMVQWAVIPDSYTDDVEIFWKQDAPKFSVKDSKLRCVFADEQTAAVVPEVVPSAPTTRPTESTNILVETRPQQATSKVESTSTQRTNVNASRDTNPVQDRQQDAGDDSNRLRLKSELDFLKKENENLKDKMTSSDVRQRNPTIDRIDNPVVDRSKSGQQQGRKGLVLFGITFNEQLVLVAFVVALLFGFSLGYFIFSCGNEEK